MGKQRGTMRVFLKRAVNAINATKSWRKWYKEQETKEDTWGIETGWSNQWLLPRLAKNKYATNATQVHSLSTEETNKQKQ